MNPLLRASHLVAEGLSVTVHCPYVPLSDQPHCFAERFQTPALQTTWIASWLLEQGIKTLPKIRCYPARYRRSLSSIFPSRPIADNLGKGAVILEDPLPLLLGQPFRRSRYQRVIGIIHTNYQRCISSQFPGMMRPCIDGILRQRYRYMARHYCTHLLQINTLIQGQFVETVPLIGVNAAYFQALNPKALGCYYMGKLEWEKGFKALIDGLARSSVSEITIFGVGKDQAAIAQYAKQRGVVCDFQGVLTRPWERLQSYRLLINASRTDLWGSVSAEALAMQKQVLIPETPQSTCFSGYRNVRCYANNASFVSTLEAMLATPPVFDPNVERLRWEHCTARLLAYLK